ncbi:MAG: hypothetical protein PHI44_02740, partial [Candidatus Ratteibacteria bacterium]|nr:hypothetical protein [Candidatus Ratteibacteria bacterium]
MGPIRLDLPKVSEPNECVIGVFAPGDPRIDKQPRERVVNIVKMTADVISGKIKKPDGSPVKVVYSDVLIDGEKQADIVAAQFKDAKVNILVGVPDT